MFVNSIDYSFQLRKSQFAKELLTNQTVKTQSEIVYTPNSHVVLLTESLAEPLPHASQLTELTDSSLVQLQLLVWTDLLSFSPCWCSWCALTWLTWLTFVTCNLIFKVDEHYTCNKWQISDGTKKLHLVSLNTSQCSYYVRETRRERTSALCSHFSTFPKLTHQPGLPLGKVVSLHFK